MVKGHVANNAEQADDLFSVADRQAGYFTAAEALALGYTYPLKVEIGWQEKRSYSYQEH